MTPPPSTFRTTAIRIAMAGLLFAPFAGLHATTITAWNFENAAVASPVNSPAPSTGTGTAGAIGMNVYPTPNVGVTSCDVLAGVSGDTGANGISNLTHEWRVRGAAGSNGAANGWSSLAPIGAQGAVFTAGTVGYGSIVVSFDWQLTAAGEGRLQLQYTTNGSTWQNAPLTLGGTTSGISVKTNSSSSNTVNGTFVQATVAEWFNSLTATITDAAAANNPNFAVRMVNASTGADCVNAGGTALNNTSGNWRFDNIVISGTALPTYTLIYDGNGNMGGSAPSDAGSPYFSGTKVTVLGNTGALTKAGAVFAGWNTAANGTGTAYAPGGTFFIAANTTLYAQYSATPSITYLGNTNTGGTAPVDGGSPYASGATVTVLGAGTLTKTGNVFAGWNTAADGTGTAYSAGATFTITTSTTLYAQWTPDTYTLAYSAGANGTLTGATPQTVNYNTSGTAVTAVPNTGYHFVNWSDSSTANPRTDANVTAGLSVTANFAINTYTLSYTAGSNGTLTGSTSQTVNYGAAGTAVTAVPASGYSFVNWSDGSTANPRTDGNVTADVSVAASFSSNSLTTLTAWTFENDAIATNNSPAPSTGSGTAGSIGMNLYASPNIGVTTDDVLQGATADTGLNLLGDLTKVWRVRATAGSNGASNGWSSAAPIGTQGAQFAVSTVGTTAGPITVSFDWYATTQGEANLQFQYTTDGSTWINAPLSIGSNSTKGLAVLTNNSSANTVTGSYVSNNKLTNGSLAGQDWFQGLTATITDAAALNNANFAIRLVNASTGADCVSTQGTALNNTSGNWRFDNVVFSTPSAVPLPDLTITASVPATATAGVDFNYTLTVSNSGAISAAGVVAQITLPVGLTFVAAAETGGAGFTAPVSAAGGVVTFTGGTLAAGASDTLTVTVSASSASTYTAGIGSVVVDPANTVAESNEGNNTYTAVLTTVVAAPPTPDLAIRNAHPGTVAPGDAADVCTIFVTNVGTAATDGSAVTITDTLPPGFTPAAAMNGATINGWAVTVAGQTVTATRSDVLAANASYPALPLTFSVAANATGALSNTVSVSGGGDVTSSNNSNAGAVNVGAATPISSYGNLIVSRSVYAGNSGTVAYPGTLANGSASVANGSYPGVWSNETPDLAFGITSPIYLDQVNKSTGEVIGSPLDLTAAAISQLGVSLTTSFPSKSELALNPTPDGRGITFMAYLAPANALDVSNSDTPYHMDPTNPVTRTSSTGVAPTQRAVVQIDYNGNIQVTPTNSYSGNNGRAALLAGGDYFTVGNAGNGSGDATILTMLSDDTGLQVIAPGAGGNATAVGQVYGAPNSSTGYQHGFSTTTLGFPAGKTGKEMNLRGLTYNPYTNTLYVSKGSGGNGINTVYQVGGPGSIPTPATAGGVTITVAPGFSQTSAATGKDSSGTAQTVYYPFGMWFADANTLYVADEGQVSTAPALVYDSVNNVYTNALPANNPTAGLQKWKFDGAKWNLVYTLINGLNLGHPFTVPNDASGNAYPTGINPATGLPWTPSNNGLRNITGQVNGDGTVTLFAVTSTASGDTDQGADPNQLVAVTDSLAATSLPASESFTVLRTAANQEVLRGVALSTPMTPSALNAWRQTYFPGSTASTGDGADTATPMHDGVENLVKFATGLDPTRSDTMPGVVAQSNDHSMLTFSYTPSAAAVAGGFTFEVEYSDSLAPGSWKTDLVDQGAIGAGGAPVTARVPKGSGGSRFLHLKIISPP